MSVIRPLNSHLQRIACEELNEKPDQIQDNLNILKEWLTKSTHLKARASDQFLVTFLRGCKYSLERAKQKLDMYYTYRTHIPEIIKDRDPLKENIHEVIKLGVALPLPIIENPGSPRITLFRIGAYDPSRVTIEHVLKVFTMLNDINLNEDDNTVVSGQLFVCDFANVSMGHIVQMQPAFFKKSIMLWKESSPIRQKGIHYINAPKMFEQVLNLIKSLLNEKMKARIFVHSTLESLYSTIPRKIMPNEYEGEAGSLQSLIDEWEKKLFSYRDYFKEESQHFGVDETKRVGQAQNPLLGIEGSFRKLDLD